MRKIINWLSCSRYISPLSPACFLCAQGAKMVLLVTGQCRSKCFYCPLSIKKQGTDCIYADEWKLADENDTDKIVKEAELIDAKGAGITGGDPLIVLERTCRYIRLLKETFGDKFHIHLYTTGVKDADVINNLASAGLDELRIHPSPNLWTTIKNSCLKEIVTCLKDNGIDVAIEIPALPGMEKEIYDLICGAEKVGVNWVNLNELEYSEGNYLNLQGRGYSYKSDISSAVAGSEKTAVEIVRKCAEGTASIGVHYCSSSFKDGVQLTNRLRRRAKNVSQSYDLVTADGTIIRGIIVPSGDIQATMRRVKKEYEIPSEYIEVDFEKSRIHIAAWVLQDIAEEIKRWGCKSYLVEEYPTADRLEVERSEMPLK